MNTTEREKQKYSQIWAAENYTSGSAVKFVEFVRPKIESKDAIVLELGCGNGTTLKELLKFSDAWGLDITIDAAIKNGISKDILFDMPVWDIHQLAEADYIVSTDFLEHIPPEKIDEVIQLIIEKTKIETIHAISTRQAIRKYQGHEVHLTVQPLSWWQTQFETHNKKQIKITLINSDDF